MFACVAGAMLLAGTGANACGDGGEDLLSSPTTLQSETSAPQPGPKDQSTAQQVGK
jgi:hypothetical protein